MIRTRIPDSKAKEILDRVLPDLIQDDPQMYQEAWEDIVEASLKPSFTEASAVLVSYGEELVAELQRVSPWVPSVSEARILRSFCPNYLRAALATFQGDVLAGHPAGGPGWKPTTELDAHLEKMCDDLFKRAEREQRAQVPGA